MSVLKSLRSLTPLLDRILVQRIAPESRTAGGIFLPESAQKELNYARVLAVGPGAIDKSGGRIAMALREGDSVLIPQFGGSKVTVGEEEGVILREGEVLAKITE